MERCDVRQTIGRAAARQVDERAVTEFGMLNAVLMENAGRGCADQLEKLGIAGTVVICCGRGNNAGDGFVLARHLDLRRHAVRVLLWGDPADLRGDAALNCQILAKCGVPLVLCGDRSEPAWLAEQLQGADWVVDALLGTGARGAPRPPLAGAIEVLNACPARKLAVDVPSGLDCDSGEASRSTFRADHTCTFVAAKRGFLVPAAQHYLGQIHVLDIGAPRKLVEEVLRTAVQLSDLSGGGEGGS